MKTQRQLAFSKVKHKRAGDSLEVSKQDLCEMEDETFRQIHYDVIREKFSFGKRDAVIFVPQGTEKILFVSSEKERARMDRKIHKNGKRPHQFVMIAIAPMAIHSVIGVIKLKTKFADQQIQFKNIIAKCTGNVWVTITAATITLVNGFYSAFASSTTAGRKTALRNIKESVQDNLLAPFQKSANASPANAEDILKSGNFSIKLVSPRQKQTLKIKNSTIKGKLLITGPVQGKRTAHDWWFTIDGGETAVRMDPTIGSKTILLAMVSGSSVGIAHQMITTKGPQGISPFEYITVS